MLAARQQRRSFLDLLSARPTLRPKQLTKLLVNVTIQGRFHVIKIVMSAENTVADLVAAVLSKYVQYCFLPILPTADPSCFDLHYSQFDFESLGKEKKLIDLGSRHFFLCRRKATEASSSTCSMEIGKATEISCLSFMEYILM